MTSSCTITPLCIIGKGGFGVVILARVEYPASYCSPPVLCALKCMKNKESCEDNEKCVKDMKKEFSRQHRLYFKSSLQSCIPRPLHILDLLDGDLKGTLGIMMEFCQGGNVIEFAKSWAVDFDECDPCEDDEEDLVYDPVKIAALCVAIIECVSDIFSVKKQLVHRDIKPDNFLVRYDDTAGTASCAKDKCTVLLGDLGLVQIRDTMSRQSSFYGSGLPTERSESEPKSFSYKPSIAGTLCYNAPESLKNGYHNQRSDAWGVVLTIWSLFNRMQQPFMTHPNVESIPPSKEYNKHLRSVLLELTHDKVSHPQLTDSEIFCSLETIEGGKYNAVYQVFLVVFDGLLNPDRLKRMTIHQARSLTNDIKYLLPRLGEGWECPSIEEYIARQLEEYDGCTGTIHSSSSSSGK
ncbi:hypothetical protein ADUPG1_000565 [Aduncisulcus paluster]|uniref:Protein kinase domain-containing protein n=1 Tax=Aduncisulcus paluster TaxID=2918883 RepID=A0ABQ5K8T2_9EUKA|nr:hypothetical protein ADUPG1_000565 [Aduncisulcus paluster]